MKDSNQPSISKGVSWADKGKGREVNLIVMKSILEITSVAKRTRSESTEEEPSTKKGKHEHVDPNVHPKNKRKPRRHYKATNLCIG